MKRAVLWLSVLCSMVFAHAASARSVYLNGVDISEVRSQTFDKAKVVIDKDGNIRIDAPQYDVKVVPSTLNDRGGPNPALKKKYYLATQPSKGSKVQYDFVIQVNGKDRRLVKVDGPQLIMEISAWLRKGTNDIKITATKNLEPVDFHNLGFFVQRRGHGISGHRHRPRRIQDCENRRGQGGCPGQRRLDRHGRKALQNYR